MGIRRRQIARIIWSVIQGAAFVATAGCAIVTIRAPESNEVLRSGAVTMQVQKDDNSCSFNNGTFRAVLNRGRPNEVDLSNAFIRPPNSNVWVATDYPLTNGSHGACGER